ncbi:ammeMemoRadiSam system radical SAM enzyme [Leptolinea tardivitalis]|nr:ammeMemoRadiSam system radical SAM enzyme [Leptolinea tardivitalis]
MLLTILIAIINMMTAFVETLDRLTKPAVLVEPGDGGSVYCLACANHCHIRPGQRGICQVRFNQDGTLMAPWGYVAGAQIDPIEKKPFNHVLPGSHALTFGMLGCDFHCSFCQNWLSSQVLRDDRATRSVNTIEQVNPEELVAYAVRNGAQIIASSYNEPLITTEWAVDVFKLAVKAGLKCVFISNGNATIQSLELLKPYLSAYKIDLKSMQEKNYRELGGKLQNILDTIQKAHDMGFWVEVVTLVIPGYNDSNEELWEAARFLTSVSADIPWHVTAFHPDYRMLDREPTSVDALTRAAEIGQEAGLHYVYAGNLPGRVKSLEDTFCPFCSTRLIQRRGYTIGEYTITAQGTCPKCGKKQPGIWTDDPKTVNLGGMGYPRRLSF